MGGAADRWRLYGLALREAGLIPVGWARRGLRGPSWRAPKPDRLLFAPKDLRTSDPTVATDFGQGFFSFAGQTVETRGRSPFEVPPPSDAWSRALYGFDWLRHMRAAGTAQTRNAARELVAEAIGPRRRGLDRGAGRETRVLARRLISFLCQSPLVLSGADPVFYQAFLRYVGDATATLERDAVVARRPSDRLVAAIALSYAALCCSGYENRLKRATRLLSAELDGQILPDGGHVSRHPGVLVEILLDLLPLRLLYASRNIAVPEALGRAIDRTMPMLRLLRGAGREIALFNGMGPTPVDQLATLFSYDSRHRDPPDRPAESGYGCLAAPGLALLADLGPAPPLASAAAAHAGCLSFEMWSRDARLVVNQGTPRAPGPRQDGTRRTGAHSTLCLGDLSHGLFLDREAGGPEGWLARRVGPALFAGPGSVAVGRETDPEGWTVVSGRHDGWSSRFGVTHERRWRLAPGGDHLQGTDRLEGSGSPLPPVAIRFHLHPAVLAEADGAGGVRLTLPGDESWRFSAGGDGTAPVAIEPSTYHGGPEGTRPTLQLVCRPAEEAIRQAPFRWSFERLSR